MLYRHHPRRRPAPPAAAPAPVTTGPIGPTDRTQVSWSAREGPESISGALTRALADSFGEPAALPASAPVGMSARELWGQL